MHHKNATSFAQALRMKVPEALNRAIADEALLYPIALAVARRQMKQWWAAPSDALTRPEHFMAH